MIRPTVPNDTPDLVAIAERTQVFKPHELVALREVLDDYHDDRGEHHAYTLETNEKIMGFVYFAPTAMTDRTWHLYWIFVDKHTQAKGLGTRMLHFVETEIKKAGGRLLLIETSGLPYYQLTRAFYLKQGYVLDAVIHDYYEDGDDMNVFSKKL